MKTICGLNFLFQWIKLLFGVILKNSGGIHLEKRLEFAHEIAQKYKSIKVCYIRSLIQFNFLSAVADEILYSYR